MSSCDILIYMSTLTFPVFNQTTSSVQNRDFVFTPALDSVRETPEWVVRQRWAYIGHRSEELRLAADTDRSFETTTVAKPKPSAFAAAISGVLDIIGVFVCINAHPNIRYTPGDKHYTCSSCERKYGLVIVDSDTITEPGVYVATKPTVIKPLTPTRQAVCRDGVKLS